jgi:hypothetical protein
VKKTKRLNNSNYKLLKQLLLNIEDINKFKGLNKELDIIIKKMLSVTEENIYFLNNILKSTSKEEEEKIIESITKTSIETRLIIEEIDKQINI